jgi:hypothetical protein
LIQETLKCRLLTFIARGVLGGQVNSLQDVSVTLHALGKLGLRWSSVERKDPAMGKVLHRALQLVLSKGNAEEVAGTLGGVALMEISWSLLPARLRKAVADSILRLFSPDKRKRRPMLATETEQQQATGTEELTRIMYSLSLLTFDAAPALQSELLPAHRLLNELAHARIGELREADKERAIIYNTVLQMLLPGSEQRPLLFRADKEEKHRKSSALQSSVISVVQQALAVRHKGLQVEAEYSAFFGAFPVDATVFEGTKVIAFVEVDGPQHYSEGSLRRKDVLKEALYRRKHPLASFTRVRFDQVNSLGSVYVGRELANFITLCMHVCNHSSEVQDECIAAASNGDKQHHAPGMHSIEPEYLHTDHCLSVRRARLQLESALDARQHTGPTQVDKANSFISSPLLDFAYADNEEYSS